MDAGKRAAAHHSSAHGGALCQAAQGLLAAGACKVLVADTLQPAAGAAVCDACAHKRVLRQAAAKLEAHAVLRDVRLRHWQLLCVNMKNPTLHYCSFVLDVAASAWRTQTRKQLPALPVAKADIPGGTVEVDLWCLQASAESIQRDLTVTAARPKP